MLSFLDKSVCSGLRLRILTNFLLKQYDFMDSGQALWTWMKGVSIFLMGTHNSHGLAPVQVDDHDRALISISDRGGEPECQTKGREGQYPPVIWRGTAKACSRHERQDTADSRFSREEGPGPLTVLLVTTTKMKIKIISLISWQSLLHTLFLSFSFLFKSPQQPQIQELSLVARQVRLFIMYLGFLECRLNRFPWEVCWATMLL